MLATSCTPKAATDSRAANENAIRELDAQWSKAASANDLDATVSFYSDDATLLPPNAPIRVGKQAIRAVWAELLAPGTSVSWQVSKVEVSQAGDLAYLIGTYVVTMKDPQGKPVTDKGKLLEVWKPIGGKWKAVADTYNSDLPIAQGGH
uniref:Ketosteroid isomerase-like protein n=1 Tax=Solibacter usitatus (strain Ellin6076) TaxID=234267 RepID=Q01XW8_SOLUE